MHGRRWASGKRAFFKLFMNTNRFCEKGRFYGCKAFLLLSENVKERPLDVLGNRNKFSLFSRTISLSSWQISSKLLLQKRARLFFLWVTAFTFELWAVDLDVVTSNLLSSGEDFFVNILILFLLCLKWNHFCEGC